MKPVVTIDSLIKNGYWFSYDDFVSNADNFPDFIGREFQCEHIQGIITNIEVDEPEVQVWFLNSNGEKKVIILTVYYRSPTLIFAK